MVPNVSHLSNLGIVYANTEQNLEQHLDLVRDNLPLINLTRQAVSRAPQIASASTKDVRVL
jgi:hypothetical protein